MPSKNSRKQLPALVDAWWAAVRPKLVVTAAGAVAVVVFMATVGLPVGSRPFLGEPAPSGSAVELANDERRGLIFDGLFRLPAEAGCGDGFTMSLDSGLLACTRGPTASPENVDVRDHRDLGDFVGELALADQERLSPTMGCTGDGTDGDRIQAVYARAADRPDRYAEMAPFIAGWARQVDATLGLRWVTDESCFPTVVEIVLSADGDDGFADTLEELHAAGLDRPDRKYVVWMDANVYCAIAEATPADLRLLAPDAVRAASVVRIDEGCWGRSEVEVGELDALLEEQPHTSFLHATRARGVSADWAPELTGQPDEPAPLPSPTPTNVSQPTSTPAPQPTPTAPGAVPTSTPAPSATTSPVATSTPGATPTAPPDVVTPSPGPTASPTPPVEATPTPAPTVTPTAVARTTTVFEGRLRGRNDVEAFTLQAGAGQLTAELRNADGQAGSPTLTLDLSTTTGETVDTVAGDLPLTLQAAVEAGTYRLTVRGGRNVDFVLVVDHAGA